jgi:UDP-N-acetylmuramyl pentapeptide synthase
MTLSNALSFAFEKRSERRELKRSGDAAVANAADVAAADDDAGVAIDDCKAGVTLLAPTPPSLLLLMLLLMLLLLLLIWLARTAAMAPP